MKRNTHLQNAEAKKDNEFYTRFEDIEKELGSYNGDTITLNTLRARFRRAGIKNPTKEAKKYLLKNNNPIEFYDIYP